MASEPHAMQVIPGLSNPDYPRSNDGDEKMTATEVDCFRGCGCKGMMLWTKEVAIMPKEGEPMVRAHTARLDSLTTSCVRRTVKAVIHLDPRSGMIDSHRHGRVPIRACGDWSWYDLKPSCERTPSDKGERATQFMFIHDILTYLRRHATIG